MSPRPVPPFTIGTIEHVARALGDLYSGTELSTVLGAIRIPDPLGAGSTKWRRLVAAVVEQQNKQGDGRPLVALISSALSPDRTLSRRADAAVARDEINQVLSLSGYQVRDDGKVALQTARTSTDSEAARRSTRLRTLLADREAHAEVIKHCRPELLRTDCYEAVFEAIKGLGDRLRRLAGVDLDGWALVEHALEGKAPVLRINNLSSVTEMNEQRGIAYLAKGVFSAFRNPSAHEPRIVWEVSERDALDVLATVSMVHRRLDTATRAARP